MMQASFKPPLHLAVLIGHLPAAELLLKHDANQTLAARGLYLPAIFYMLQQQHGYPSLATAWKDTDHSGPTETMFQLLIKDCAARACPIIDYQETSQLRGSTPLILAVQQGMMTEDESYDLHRPYRLQHA